ncbi:MAG: ABC transporter permease [Spirochaetales bacterium]|jgi:simple sugar transport system permease protein|nr:ABC transporter permease [Spirochaetales bacterium]
MNTFLAIFNADLLVSTIRLATPIALAAIGATICERSGIVNIAMEGIMVVGAFMAVVFTFLSGSPWVGLVAGILGGGIFSLIHGAATISLHMDHTVSGAVLNILALGVTRYLMILFYGHPGTTDSIPISLKAYQFAIPGLSRIPLLGPLLFNQTPIVYLSFLILIAATILMGKTKTGLHIRAAGEHPLALETIGVSVYKIRYLGVFISGLLSGAAGAYLSIENAVSFSEGMTSGKGFIALAAMISGGWSPIGAYLAALFFGFADALQIRFQIMSRVRIPAEIFIIFPYVLCIIAVAGLVRRSRAPKADGKDFMIEKSE